MSPAFGGALKKKQSMRIWNVLGSKSSLFRCNVIKTFCHG